MEISRSSSQKMKNVNSKINFESPVKPKMKEQSPLLSGKSGLNISPIKTLKLTETMNGFIDKSQSFNLNKKNYSRLFRSPQKQKLSNEIDSKLFKIYEFYSNKGDKFTIASKMKFTNFLKVLSDSGLIDKKLDQTRAELIYNSDQPKKESMTFDCFLQSLVKVSEAKFSENFPEKNPIKKKNNLNFIVERLLLLYENLNITNYDMSLHLNLKSILEMKNITINEFNDIDLDNKCISILQQTAPVLYELYKIYFETELNSNEEKFILESSKKGFINFLKNFDICPSLLNLSNIMNLFKKEIVSDNLNNEAYTKIVEKIGTGKISSKYFYGQYFNFFKFIRSLVRIAEANFQYIEEKYNIELDLYDKICLIMEKIEFSDGFTQITGLKSTLNSKISFLIPQEILKALNSKLKRIEDNIKPNNVKKENIEYSKYIIENYSDDLKKIFKNYCNIENSVLNPFMKFSNLSKFYKEIGIIKMSSETGREFGIKINDFDLIFQRIMNSTIKPNYTGKATNLKNESIDFTTFVNSIEIIAKILSDKVNLDTRKTIDIIIINHIIPLIQSNKVENYTLDDLNNDPQLNELLQIISKNYKIIFESYHEQPGKIFKFEYYLKFCTDFEIYPDVCSKNKIEAVYKKHFENPETKKIKDLDKFSSSILDLAFMSKLSSLENLKVNKVLWLVERIAYSEGNKKILKKVGNTRPKGVLLDLLSDFREKYPNFFNKITNREGFFEILEYN